MASFQLSEAQLGQIVASVTNSVEASIQEELGTTLLKLDVRKADAIFFMVCATLVFVMQVGFALLEVGSVSVKNTKNILLKNIMDLCVSAISFYLIGYGLGWGKGNGFAGRDSFAMRTPEFASLEVTGVVASKHAQAFFSLCFAATAATIVSGAVAERFRFQTYAFVAFLMSGIVFPVVMHWVWADDGWLNPLRDGAEFLDVGVVDYAGSGFVHIVGGISALWAVYFVGPRQGRFMGTKGTVQELPQQSPVFQVIGGLLMWYGWFGFNCGSIKTLEGAHLNSVVRVGLVHSIGGATGGLVTMALDMWQDKRSFRPHRMIAGVLCALVSISASAALIEPGIAMFNGAVAGFLYRQASSAMLRFQLDDVVDAVSIHLCGGIWGVIAASLVSRPGFLKQAYGDDYSGCGVFYGCSNGGKQFGAALVYILATAGWVSAVMVPVYFILNRFNLLRVKMSEEIRGIDHASHGGDAYSEFQPAIFKFMDKQSGTESSVEMRVRSGDAAKFAIHLSKLLETDVTHH